MDRVQLKKEVCLIKTTLVDPQLNLNVVINLTDGHSRNNLAKLVNQTKPMAIKEEIENEINKGKLLKMRLMPKIHFQLLMVSKVSNILNLDCLCLEDQ